MKLLLALSLSLNFPIVTFVAADSTIVDTNSTRKTVRIDTTSITKKPRPRKPRTRVSRPTPIPTPTLPPGQSYCGFIDIRDLPRICYETLDPTSPRNTIENEIRRATRTIGVPALTARTQPTSKAIINIPTILYTTSTVFTRDVTLLGQTTRIEATPRSYVWHHGDGSKQTTRNPGRAHPHHDITHTYRQPQNTAKIRVDTVYQIRYRLADGTWATLSNTLTITGPETQLTIAEARPYLTKN